MNSFINKIFNKINNRRKKDSRGYFSEKIVDRSKNNKELTVEKLEQSTVTVLWENVQTVILREKRNIFTFSGVFKI